MNREKVMQALGEPYELGIVEIAIKYNKDVEHYTNVRLYASSSKGNVTALYTKLSNLHRFFNEATNDLNAYDAKNYEMHDGKKTFIDSGNRKLFLKGVNDSRTELLEIIRLLRPDMKFFDHDVDCIFNVYADYITAYPGDQPLPKELQP